MQKRFFSSLPKAFLRVSPTQNPRVPQLLGRLFTSTSLAHVRSIALSQRVSSSAFSSYTCRSFLPVKIVCQGRFQSTAASEGKGSGANQGRKYVAYWLYAVSGLIFLIIVVGGITRLTESGLSITEWKPVVGALPPMTQAEWQKEFEKYIASPEFRQRDAKNFTVDDFKKIFFWEWFHRLLGRFCGVAYLLPYLYFAKKGYIPKGMHSRLFGLFALLGLQGCIGWIMVRSGLDHDNFKEGNKVRVSHYRLTLHLGAALALYTGTLWTAMQTHTPNIFLNAAALTPKLASLRRVSGLTAGWILLTSLLGGFVAGLDAGQIYNEWPLMAGQLIPVKELYHFSPWWRSALDHDATVQFHHRMAAYVAVSLVLALSVMPRQSPGLPPQVGLALRAVQFVVLCQFLLGVTTLLYGAPTELAATHQGGAVALYTTALRLFFTLRFRAAPF